MKPSSYLISRRHLLQGVGTVALGLPVLDIMKPAVASAAADEGALEALADVVRASVRALARRAAPPPTRTL